MWASFSGNRRPHWSVPGIFNAREVSQAELTLLDAMVVKDNDASRVLGAAVSHLASVLAPGNGYELAGAKPNESGAVFQGKKDGSEVGTHVEMEGD